MTDSDQIHHDFQPFPSQQNRYSQDAQDASEMAISSLDSLVGLSQEISHAFPKFGMKVMRSSWNL